jgi:hypothetical protein
MSKDSLEEEIFKTDKNALSRGDLSGRHDGTPLSNEVSPIDKSIERRNKFHR